MIALKQKLVTVGLCFSLLCAIGVVQAKSKPVSNSKSETITVSANDENTPPEIKYIIESTDSMYNRIYLAQGVEGLKNMSQYCYATDPNALDCVYIDVISYVIYTKHSGNGASAEVKSYFSKPAIDARLAKNFYQPRKKSAKEQQDHFNALVALISQQVDILDQESNSSSK